MIKIINQNAENLWFIQIFTTFLSIEKADNEQNNFANELKNFDKGLKTLEKNLFYIT